ncbi:MAG: hypothetical protein Kow0080_12940 [Candidatus Promineifilaceae bacterium]
MALFSAQQMAHAEQVLDKVRKEWLKKPGVTAVDLGFKWQAGEMTRKLAIRVHVTQKKPIADLTPEELFPKEVDGVEVDIIEANYGIQTAPDSGSPVQLETAAHGRSDRFENIPIGVSIGSPLVSAGTLGAKVIDNKNGDEMVLSNWHILAGGLGAAVGLSIWQPGGLDGGGEADKFAELTRWVLGPYDAAVARLTGQRTVQDQTFEGRHFAGTAVPQLGMEVWKSGRTTGLTNGFIDGIKMSTALPYSGAGVRTMRDVFRIVPLPGAGNIEVSLGGDSGSVWVDTESGHAVGLHFAGETGNAPEHALACEIIPVLETLNVRLPDMVVDTPPKENTPPPVDIPTEPDEPVEPVKPVEPDKPVTPPDEPLSLWAKIIGFFRWLFGLNG